MTDIPNTHDLSSSNPVSRFIQAAMAELGITDAQLWINESNASGERAPANRARVGVGRYPNLDAVMAKAHELYEAAQ